VADLVQLLWGQPVLLRRRRRRRLDVRCVGLLSAHVISIGPASEERRELAQRGALALYETTINTRRRYPAGKVRPSGRQCVKCV